MKRKYSSTGLFFFDPIDLSLCLVNHKTNVYIRKIGVDAFVFGAVQAPLHHFPYDPHLWNRGSIYAAAPHEPDAKRYWPVLKKSFFRNQVIKQPELCKGLFNSEGALDTTARYTAEQIYLLTDIRPEESNVCFFTTACNHEHVAALERARLTETVFMEWLKGYFEDHLSVDNIDIIQAAVEALDTSAHGRLTEETHREALKQLDITPFAEAYLLVQLRQGSLAENTEEDIRALFTLKTGLTSHAEQYFIQTDLKQIVESQAARLDNESPSPRSV